MLLSKITTWLKRATGIGYMNYPPLESMIDHERASDMEEKTRTLRDEVTYIEELLSLDHPPNGQGKRTKRSRWKF